MSVPTKSQFKQMTSQQAELVKELLDIGWAFLKTNSIGQVVMYNTKAPGPFKYINR